MSPVSVCSTAQEAYHSIQSTYMPTVLPQAWTASPVGKAHHHSTSASHQAWRSQRTIPHHFPSTSWGRRRSQGSSLLQQAGEGHLSTTREFIPNLSGFFPRLQVATLPPFSPMPSDSFLHYHWKMLSCELMCSSINVFEKYIRSSEGRDT